MNSLSREIRFALVPDYEETVSNSWSGWPSTNRIAPYLVLKCVVAGEPDPATGFVCNVKFIDDLLRDIVTQDLIPNRQSLETAELLLIRTFQKATNTWNSESRLKEINLQVSPYLSYSISTENESMIVLTQQFEFSAAHRLHCDDLSESENQTVFGKCNNPEGHGHNYVVEVSIMGDRNKMRHGQLTALHEFESIVKKEIIDRLDHKHLNRDIDYFSTVNPSVENIAVAIWDWLEGKFETAILHKVRVFETPKTWAEYSG